MQTYSIAHGSEGTRSVETCVRVSLRTATMDYSLLSVLQVLAEVNGLFRSI